MMKDEVMTSHNKNKNRVKADQNELMGRMRPVGSVFETPVLDTGSNI
jgi:hypothetical protein